MRWIALFAVWAATVTADEITEIDRQLTLEAKRLELLLAQEKLLDKELDLANTRKSIAEARKAAATSAAEAEAAQRLTGLPNIEINAATITVANDPSRFCFAKDFLVYRCHRQFDCPEFTVDDALCALPGGADEPMLLKVNFSCGTQQRDRSFPVGSTAWITCR
ncbi:hypothetical protein [Citreimonas sp.]|uniref:hypothetical protein n=1 Tax=Citreimonas sp. TaxID=3036715 RepID=UPI00405928DF